MVLNASKCYLHFLIQISVIQIFPVVLFSKIIGCGLGSCGVMVQNCCKFCVLETIKTTKQLENVAINYYQTCAMMPSCM